MSMLELIELSNSYGMNEDYVLAGGGNTSFKTKDELFIKSSGFALATIEADGFCRMDRKKLENIWNKEYSSDEKKREAEFLSDIMNSRAEGETKRPSVETLVDSGSILPTHHVCKAKTVVLNLLPSAKINYKKSTTGEWLAFCGACPAPEIANAFNRAGIEFNIVNGLLGLDYTPEISLTNENTKERSVADKSLQNMLWI